MAGIVVVAFSLFVPGCGSASKNAQTAPNRPQAGAAAPVTVAVAAKQSVPVEIEAIGNVQPYRAVQVKSMVDGQIDKVLLRQGEDVTAGQVLFELDKKPFQAALDQALGKLAQDEATAANSKAQADRASALLKEGVLAAQDAQAAQAQSQANAAAVQADRAAVENAKVNLAYTEIKAPISARAGAILVNLGNLVKANDTNPLTTLNEIEPLYVSFNVPETNLAAIRSRAKNSLKVSAALQNEPKPEVGTLTFIDNAVDSTTGSIKLMATFPNRDRRLWPGSFVNVTLRVGVDQNAIVVPAAAVQTGPQGKYVFVVQPDGTAATKAVTSSRNYGALAVIASGVDPGQRVVVNGQIRLVPNAKVNVVRTEPLSAALPQNSNSVNLSGIQ